MRRGREQLTEVAQRVSPDHFAVVYGLQVPAVPLVDRDIEVVGPELDHSLIQLSSAVHPPNDGRLLQFPDRVLAVPGHQRVGI